MKIGEKFIDGEGSTFHVKETFDAQPSLDYAAQMRSAGVGQTGHSRFVGTVPGWLLDDWAREAGLRHDQQDELKALVKKKLLSGEFSKLRVWDGTY